MARINKQLQREISVVLETRIKNKTVRDAIITEVDCSRDLERAKVYFTAMDAERRKPLLRALIEIKGVVRSMLGETMRLRRVPSLEFRIDESADYGSKIDRILSGLGLGDNFSRAEGMNPEELPDETDSEPDVYDEEDDADDDFDQR